MKCPKCGRRGKKAFNGYCTRVHESLSKAPSKVRYNCAVCDVVVVRTPSRVSKGGKVYCKRCSKNTGETHPRWKEGQYTNTGGYRMVLKGKEYHLEHRLTWEEANDACLLPMADGKVAIHHINMVKTDNRPENLCLISSEDHGRIHRLIDAGRDKEAKSILINWLKQQAFFLLHSEHIEHIRATPLSDILKSEA